MDEPIEITMRIGFLARTFAASLLVISCHCSHCVDKTLVDIKSSDGAYRSELELRHCGGTEGWAVWMSGKALPRRQVFVGKMPPPTSVTDIENGVSIRWTGPSSLEIRAPSWIKPFVIEKRYGDVSISYEVNPIPYPKG